MENVILIVLTVFVVWAFLLTPYLVLRTRQRLFVIRDTVFLQQEHNREYEQFREHINTMIRFAERISWARLLVNLFLFRKLLKNQPSSLSFRNSDLHNSYNESIKLVAKLFILRSPLLIVLFSLITIVFLLKESLLPKLKNLFISVLNLETQAMNEIGL